MARQRTAGLFTYSVVVVDNDANAPARDVVERLEAELHLAITYSVEPEHTIPAARNHAVRLASGNYIGIIDDDEFPPPDWLLRLYDGIHAFDADGVLGPVLPFFTSTPPAWLTKSGFCELPLARTGTPLKWTETRTGNVLVKKEVFQKHDLRFDPQFKTGGSDQEFFRQAMARGSRFVAVEEAPVFEVVPPARWRRRYWLKRALVNGFNARRYATRSMSFTRQACLTVKSAIACLVYAISLPACLVLGQHWLMAALEKGSYHLSRVSASFGLELWKQRDF